MDLIRFNPTLVRLRRDNHFAPQPPALWFQSHAGSIEAARILVETKTTTKFQSHAGSIEARPSTKFTLPIISVSIPRWFD